MGLLLHMHFELLSQRLAGEKCCGLIPIILSHSNKYCVLFSQPYWLRAKNFFNYGEVSNNEHFKNHLYQLPLYIATKDKL